MDINFSSKDQAFQREGRDRFGGNMPLELRRKMVTGEMLKAYRMIQWQRRLDVVPLDEDGGFVGTMSAGVPADRVVWLSRQRDRML